MLQGQIIQELNRFLKNYLNLNFEPLKQDKYNLFILEGNYDAVNHIRNDSKKIKVLHWFDNFYFYIELKFIEDHKLISISVFQGEPANDTMNQLFRAEWDDYNLDDESRPQPHWHITRDKALHENFGQLINDKNETEKNTFEFFEETNLGIFNTNKIHFAMSSDWQNKKPFVHKIDNPSKIANWFEGVLEHIKYELTN